MISEDAANLGVKAIYVWAGLLVPTVVILYFFYPEVSRPGILRAFLSLIVDLVRRCRPADELTTSWTSFTNVVSRLVISKRPKRLPSSLVPRRGPRRSKKVIACNSIGGACLSRDV
jgi:hypothetical protein